MGAWNYPIRTISSVIVELARETSIGRYIEDGLVNGAFVLGLSVLVAEVDVEGDEEEF